MILKSIGLFTSGFVMAVAISASADDCVVSEFVQDYCYKGLAKTLDLSSIAIEPVQYGFAASTIIEIKKKELVKLVTTCSNGPQPDREYFRVVKDERQILSQERYKKEDAVQDILNEYGLIRTRLTQHLCAD